VLFYCVKAANANKSIIIIIIIIIKLLLDVRYIVVTAS